MFLNLTMNLSLSPLHSRAQKLSSASADDRIKLDELDKNMIKRKAQLYEIEQSLPQKNSTYLKVTITQLTISPLPDHKTPISSADHLGQCQCLDS
jgi:hypothetical protein